MSERLPFDPSRIRAPAGKKAERSSSVLSVQQLNALIREAISQQLPATVQVLGEIGNISRPVSGHVYFTLKDSHSELRCVCRLAGFLPFQDSYGDAVRSGAGEPGPRSRSVSHSTRWPATTRSATSRALMK